MAQAPTPKPEEMHPMGVAYQETLNGVVERDRFEGKQKKSAETMRYAVNRSHNVSKCL